jgi:hypothetical protein
MIRTGSKGGFSARLGTPSKGGTIPLSAGERSLLSAILPAVSRRIALNLNGTERCGFIFYKVQLF